LREQHTPPHRFGFRAEAGVTIVPVMLSTDNIGCERRDALDSAKPEEGLLTVEDLARILRCGKTKAWQIVNSSELPIIRIGRLVRISPEDVAEFVRKNRS
jgi:excisionase family DNA binding protein